MNEHPVKNGFFSNSRSHQEKQKADSFNKNFPLIQLFHIKLICFDDQGECKENNSGIRVDVVTRISIKKITH